MHSTRNRIRIEDTLKHLHEYEYEGDGRAVTVESAAGALGCSRDLAGEVLNTLGDMDWVQHAGLEYTLTDTGRDAARQIIRTHRLIETRLAAHSDLPSSEWHRRADRMEHRIPLEEVEQLDRDLGHPRFDPHGDPIPTPSGLLPPHQGKDLMSCISGEEVTLLHVADEPEGIGRSLAGKGLAPGQMLRVKDRGNWGMKVELDGEVLKLSRAEASELQVGSVQEGSAEGIPLSDLEEGQTGEVAGLSPACRGSQRTRLLDLGFVRGSRISVELHSPLGSPTAYRVRGALIALRPSQARWVLLDRRSVA